MKPRIAMICSAARSGSTLLDTMIGGHHDVASLGEFSFLGKAIKLDQDCSCGAKISQCDNWQRVLDVIAERRGVSLRDHPYALDQWYVHASTVVDRQKQTRWYEGRRRLASAYNDFRYTKDRSSTFRPPLAPALKRGVNNAFFLYDAISECWQKSMLVDSSKNVHKATALFEESPQQVKVLYLTRDGRGVFNSRASTGFSDSEALGGWLNYNRRAYRILSRRVDSDSLLRVRYEDLVEETDQTLKKICQFLGLDFDSSMRRVNPATSHLLNGNDMRKRGEQLLKLDERWKHQLTEHQLQLFEQKAGKMNRLLGYVG